MQHTKQISIVGCVFGSYTIDLPSSGLGLTIQNCLFVEYSKR